MRESDTDLTLDCNLANGRFENGHLYETNEE